MHHEAKANILGDLAKMIWEAYPDEDIEDGTVRQATGACGWYGHVMRIRVRCWLDDGARYFAVDAPVERLSTAERLFDEVRHAIAVDGPGWIAKGGK